MGPDFWREMPEALRALDADDSVRVVLIRGEGSHFTYGLDLMGMMDSLGPLLTAEGNLALERTKLLKLIGEMQQATEGWPGAASPSAPRWFLRGRAPNCVESLHGTLSTRRPAAAGGRTSLRMRRQPSPGSRLGGACSRAVM